MLKFIPNLAITCLSLTISMTASEPILPGAIDLRVGPLLENPVGYGERTPQFSWKLPPGASIDRQAAYQVVCARAPENLAGRPDLWDSGWISSEQSTFVDYAGEPLQSRDIAYWKVRYKTPEGEVSAWSPVARFEMALLDPADWQARWIYLPEEKPEETAPAPYLRRSFRVEEKPVARARVYAAARGIYELQINGERIGREHFAPEWTDYTKRLHFMTYDLTDQLQAGKNVIGGLLGEMWYAGVFGLGSASNQYGEIPELLLQLEITYADGSRQMVVTDESWRGKTGPIVFSNIYLGENYDARLELGAWSSPGYDAAGWLEVGVKEIDSSILLEAKPNQPVRAIMEIPARSVNEPEPGRFVFDLGQNIVGWPRIKVPGEEGRTYTLRFAEMLEDNGTLYTDNYRAAKSIDTYISRGDEEETWEPRLTFHGFRYVELSGLPDGVRPDQDRVTGVVLHNDMPKTGHFASSDETLNQLQSNIEWGQRGNFLAVPTDCPQRDERLGWTGDAQVFCATANYNFDTLAFFVKWAADMRDSQRADGSIPFYAPYFPRGRQNASTAWGDAAVIVPWEVYQSFGYKRILEDNFGMMSEWLRFYEEHESTVDLIHSGFTFGDWLQPFSQQERSVFGDTANSLIGTAYFARCADLVARTARILGKEEDYRRRTQQFEAVRSAFQKAFFDEEGRLTTPHETQTGYLLAIAFNLLTDDIHEKAVKHLVRHIREVADGHLRTGFLGTPLIAPVLSMSGHTDLAYELLFKRSYPGWFFSIDQGATTMWERWNSYTKADGFGDADMNSFNHYAYGAIGEWMYETVAGLALVEPGYKVIRFSPKPGDPLIMAAASLETPYGKASSAWKQTPEGLRYSVTIPPNTSGELYLEGEVKERLSPGHHQFILQGPTGYQWID